MLKGRKFWGASMTCVHLQELYKLCQEHELRLGSSDLIRVICSQCREEEVCPSTLTDEYDARQAGREPAPESGSSAP
jgi:hypothetical protein